MPACGPARRVMPPLPEPTGNFCADGKNIGSDTAIPAVPLAAASGRPATVTHLTS